MSVKVVRAALDIIKKNGADVLVLRGVIIPESLDELQVADYQREILPSSTVEEIESALIGGEIPDIDLGMRGERMRNSKDEEGGDIYYLQDPVFIIDGLQRVTAARKLLNKADGRVPRLGAVIHLNTNEEWERERFRVLNNDRVRLNSNVLVRNLRHDYPGIDLLYRLSEQKEFTLGGKISWQQRMPRGAMITAVTFLRSVSILHSHLGPGRSSGAVDLARGWDKIVDSIGKNTARHNIKTFFEVLDECWQLRSITYVDRAPQLRSAFLTVVAQVFSDHLDFWDAEKFIVPKYIREKLRLFNVNDPHVSNLASSSGTAKLLLYQLVVEHINRGKRTRHLKPRQTRSFDMDEDCTEETPEEGE